MKMATSNPNPTHPVPDGIVRRREPASEGGELYYRCTGCGREADDSPESILHASDCSRRTL